jgi:hypothetical protein
MDGQGILGVLAIVVGGISLAAGLLLVVAWPYWLDVLAILGGALVVVAGIVLLRRSGRDRHPRREP